MWGGDRQEPGPAEGLPWSQDGRENLIFKAQACGHLIPNIPWLPPQAPISLLLSPSSRFIPSMTPAST